MTIETDKVLGMIAKLENARHVLTPAAMRGEEGAAKPREIVFDVIEAMKHWEGAEVEPGEISTTAKALENARALIPDGQFDEADEEIAGVVEDLKAEVAQ